MFSVCSHCGMWEVEKEIQPAANNPEQALEICSLCGHKHPFAYLPLFIVAGPSGAGKSTACAAMVDENLVGGQPDVVVLESDILWGVAYTEPEEWPKYHDMWLRICYNIHQSGRSVLLFGAGLNPDNMESCSWRRYFSRVHYLALVGNEDELAERLRARPQWRNSSDDEFVEGQLNYNRWFVEQAEQGLAGMEALNTSGISVAETVTRIQQWIIGHCEGL